MHIVDLLDMVVQADGGRVAVGRGDSAQTYAQLQRAAAGVARTIAAGPAGSLLLVAPNDDVIPSLVFGADLAGIPFVPLNYRLADDALRGLVERSTEPVLVVAEGVVDRVGPIPGVRILPIEEARAGACPVDPVPEDAELAESGDDVAIMLFTSGTTGTPKSALLRHRHLVSYVLANVDFLSADPAEASLVSVPPYHIAGMMGVLSGIYAGRRIVYLPSFSERAWVDLAESESITHAMIVPTMLGRLLDELERSGRTLPCLRHLSSGGGRMPRQVIERALRMLPHVDFVNAYGLTETSSTITVLGPEDHREAATSTDPTIANRLSSVGRPLPSVELQVRSAGGEPLPTGEIGEFWVRGEYIAGEYAGRRDLSDDGWFRTKDRGWQDAAGYLYLDGRLDDVIVRGGENIAPAEVEDALLTQPEIVEAAVFGAPDEEWGEAVVAAVVLREPSALEPETIRERVRGVLRSSRTPARIVIVPELPYSDTGKLLRRVLRDTVGVASGEGDGNV